MSLAWTWSLPYAGSLVVRDLPQCWLQLVSAGVLCHFQEVASRDRAVCVPGRRLPGSSPPRSKPLLSFCLYSKYGHLARNWTCVEVIEGLHRATVDMRDDIQRHQDSLGHDRTMEL